MPEAKAEHTEDRDVSRPEPVAHVPGLGRIAEAFRCAFPTLTDSAIRKVLRMPLELGSGAGPTIADKVADPVRPRGNRRR